MSKLKEVSDQPGLFLFNCPGCKVDHFLNTNPENGVAWTWNGSIESPTAMPSLWVNSKGGAPRCHFYIQEGTIKYLQDCDHVLAGQTVDIPEYQF